MATPRKMAPLLDSVVRNVAILGSTCSAYVIHVVVRCCVRQCASIIEINLCFGYVLHDLATWLAAWLA